MLHHISMRQKIIVMAAVMSSMFLVALDQTIIATALARIVEDFNSFSSLSWVVTAYLLTSTVTVPLAGKISDIFGRRLVLVTGVSIFTIASLLSGLSGDIGQLILFRAIQGIGGGIITANAFTIIGDLFSPKERGKWQGLIGGVFGLASVLGPLLGGFLTDPHTFIGLTTDWRWTFWINVPIGIISLALIARYCPPIRHDHKPILDYKGAAFLAIALSSLVLAVDNTDKIFASVIDNTDLTVTAIKTILFSVSAISVVAFVWLERKAAEPIIPLNFFRNRNFVTVMIVALLMGAAFLGSILYLTQFNQQVFGANATEAGLMMLPMVFMLTLSSAVGGFLTSKTGKYKSPLIIGFVIATVSIAALSLLSPESPYMHEAIIMSFVGLGLGMGLPIITLAVQNEFSQRELGAATASTQLFRSLGSTVGTAVLGGMLTTGIAVNLGNINQNDYVQTIKSQPAAAQMLGDEIDADMALNLNTPDFKERVNQGLEQSLATSQAPVEIKNQIKEQFKSKQEDFEYKIVHAFSDSLSKLFYTSAGLMAVATLAATFIKEKPLRRSLDETPGVVD